MNKRMKKRNGNSRKSKPHNWKYQHAAARLGEVQIGLERGESQRAIARRLGCDDKTIRRDIEKLELSNEAREAIGYGAPAEPFLRAKRARKAQIVREGRLAEEELDQRHSTTLAQEVLDILAGHSLFRADEVMIAEDLERSSWRIPDQRTSPRVDAVRTAAFANPGPLPSGKGEMGAVIEHLVAWLLKYVLLRAPEHKIRTTALAKLSKAVKDKNRRPAIPDPWGMLKFVKIERRRV